MGDTLQPDNLTGVEEHLLLPDAVEVYLRDFVFPGTPYFFHGCSGLLRLVLEGGCPGFFHRLSPYGHDMFPVRLLSQE